MNFRRSTLEPVQSEDVPDRNIHIDGTVEGKLCGGHVVLGSNARVKGDVFATAVMIHGCFRGHIEAQSVHLRQTCQVEGTIRHRSLVVDLGARFEGISQPQPAVPAPPLAAPAGTIGDFASLQA